MAESTNTPLVSAVIPTRNRPDMLLRAVRSALAQSYTELEVIVVLDGPDITTVERLADIDDPRLRIVQLDQNLGGGDARNIGVQVARGEWIAFLDDDDEWLPNKVEKQVKVALASAYAEPIVASQLVERSHGSEVVRPALAPFEPLSEYLLCRNSLNGDAGLLQTSTLFARRRLLMRIGFKSGLCTHQDWDWLLSAVQHNGVGIEFITEPLAIWHCVSASVSRSTDWRRSLEWAHSRRDLMTPRAYAGFLTLHVAFRAVAQHHWRAFFPLLWDAFHNGSPRAVDLIRYFGFWFLPVSTRRRMTRVMKMLA